MSIEELLAEGRDISKTVPCIDEMVELDRTDHAVKFRLTIDANLFLQVYANSQSGSFYKYFQPYPLREPSDSLEIV